MIIHTLTANLLWEETFYYGAITTGKTQRANRSTVQVGGKGLNVARLLARLSHPHISHVFVGGYYADAVKRWLQGTDLQTCCYEHPGNTVRPGLVVRTPGSPETTYLGPDSEIHPESIKEIISFWRKQATPMVIAVCGSIPQWADDRWQPLRDFCQETASMNHWVVDTYGPPLEWFANQPIDLIKINADEWAPFVGREENVRAQQVVITDGARSISGWSENAPPWSFAPPKVKEISPTGSGDVFLAALLHHYYLGELGWETAAREASRFGAANAACSGIANFGFDELPPRPVG